MKTVNNVKKINTKYIFLCVTTALFLSCFGCKNTEEEVIPTDYNDGIYTPKDQPYTLTLPSLDWKIEGKEVSDNILFTYKNNQIQVEVITKNVDEITNSFPVEQIELEQDLKDKGYLDCEVMDFNSTYDYIENAVSCELNYAYLDYQSGFYVLERNIAVSDRLFKLTATADANNYPAVQNALNQFTLNEDLTDATKDSGTKLLEKEQNVYTSYDGMYTLLLPYESWTFHVDEETNVTTITSENKSLTVYEIDSLEQNNTLTYEVPRNLSALQKQIDAQNLNNDKILFFHVQTVDAVSDIELSGHYRTFYYLLELSDETNTVRYYSYYEYRDENNIYKIVGTTNSPYLVDCNKLVEISKSFTLQ